MILNLRQKKLTVLVEGQPAQLIWIKPVYDDIYQVSIQYLEEPRAPGFSLWYARINQQGECEFISCTLYLSPETIAIREEEAKKNPGKELLAKLGIR